MIGTSTPMPRQIYDRGLGGLVAGDTAIGTIDGLRSGLWFRGYPIDQLAASCSFEQVSHLILCGELPDSSRLADWEAELRAWRQPPEAALRSLHRVPTPAHPLAQYRTMLTVAACHIPEPDNTDLDEVGNSYELVCQSQYAYMRKRTRRNGRTDSVNGAST